MKPSRFALLLLAAAGLTFATTAARAEDPAPVKITPEMQALIAQVLQTLSSMKGDLEAMGIDLPAELTQGQAAEAQPAAAATATLTASDGQSKSSSSTKPSLRNASAGGRLSTGHLSTGSLSINGAARLSDAEWRELFSRRQP